jgi:hypothetical protein
MKREGASEDINVVDGTPFFPMHVLKGCSSLKKQFKSEIGGFERSIKVVDDCMCLSVLVRCVDFILKQSYVKNLLLETRRYNCSVSSTSEIRSN